LQGAIEGAAQGITSVGLNYLVEEMDVNPLLANIGFSAISTAINSTLQSFAPTGEKDIFKHIYETYEKNALTLLGAGDPRDPNYAWQQAAYIAQIQDFTTIIKDHGLETALNTYATSFFNSTAVNAIMDTGKTIGEYFEGKLNQVSQEQKEVDIVVIDSAGKEVGKVKFAKNENGEWEPIGKEEKGYWSRGELGVDFYGDLKYYGYGEIYEEFVDLGVFQKIENGKQKYIEIRDSEGNLVLTGTPKEGSDYIYYNPENGYDNIQVTDYLNNRSYSFVDWILEDYSELDETNNTTLFEIDFDSMGNTELSFDGSLFTEEDIDHLKTLNDIDKEEVLSIFYYPGIGNPESTGIAPGYLKGLGEQMAIASEGLANNTYIASYENSPRLLDKAQNCWAWYKDARDITSNPNEITDHIIIQMVEKFGGNLPEDMVGIAYSGDGDPLLQGLNQHPNIDMKTVAFVGAPLWCGRTIDNDNVDNLLMFAGENDLVAKANGFLEHDFKGSTAEFNSYKFELKDVNHTEYTYDPIKDLNPDPLKVKASKFIAEVSNRVHNSLQLESFLDYNKGLLFDEKRGVYIVNLDEVEYED